MKEEEARTLVTMMAASTSTRLLADEKLVWEQQLLPLDADLATKTVLSGRNTWRRFPSWAQFKEVYKAEQRLLEPVGEQRSQIPEGKRGVEAPEWSNVWYWCRIQRDPPEMRSFPQQRGHVDDANILSMEEYEVLRDEWIKAGKPKSKKTIPMARG